MIGQSHTPKYRIRKIKIFTEHTTHKGKAPLGAERTCIRSLLNTRSHHKLCSSMPLLRLSIDLPERYNVRMRATLSSALHVRADSPGKRSIHQNSSFQEGTSRTRFCRPYPQFRLRIALIPNISCNCHPDSHRNYFSETPVQSARSGNPRQKQCDRQVETRIRSPPLWVAFSRLNTRYS